MEEKHDIFDHLKAVNPSVPDDSYFENLAQQVILSQQKTKVIPLYKRPVVWISAVAAILLVSLLVVNLTSSDINQNSDPLLALNDLSSDELYNYIDENIDDFDIEMIAEALDDQGLDEMANSAVYSLETDPEDTPALKTTEAPISVSLDDIDIDDILDYFNTEGIDPDEIEDGIFI